MPHMAVPGAPCHLAMQVGHQKAVVQQLDLKVAPPSLVLSLSYTCPIPQGRPTKPCPIPVLYLSYTSRSPHQADARCSGGACIDSLLVLPVLPPHAAALLPAECAGYFGYPGPLCGPRLLRPCGGCLLHARPLACPRMSLLHVPSAPPACPL